MLKGGVIMDVMNPEQARIAQAAGACAGASTPSSFSIVVHLVHDLKILGPNNGGREGSAGRNSPFLR